jgi:hypothetical protein
MREAPESVRIGIQAVRPTMRLVWNERAVQARTEYDAFGKPKRIVFDPRWELWDTDAEGQAYMVTRLQEPDGSFRDADYRLVEFLNLINPERYDGDPAAMLQALVDDPNQRIEDGAEAMFQDLAREAAKWGGWLTTPKSYVPAQIN